MTKKSIRKGRRSREGADVPYTVDDVVAFVAERKRIAPSRLSGRTYLEYLPHPSSICIIVQLDGKDYLEVEPLSRIECRMRQGLRSLIETDGLVRSATDPDGMLEKVPLAKIFKLVAGNADLLGLRDWVTVSSNREVRDAMSTQPSKFGEMWNDCGFKPRFQASRSGEFDFTFERMKRLQEARSRRLRVNPVAYLLERLHFSTFADGEYCDSYAASLDIVLQECRSFDWSAVVDGLVRLLGGAKGWMEGRCDGIARGLVFYDLRG
jgi:hypothetical protein